LSTVSASETHQHRDRAAPWFTLGECFRRNRSAPDDEGLDVDIELAGGIAAGL